MGGSMLVNDAVVVLFSPISTTAVFVVRFDDCSDAWLVCVINAALENLDVGRIGR